MNLILIGLKASGKSTTGKLLAEKFHWKPVDLIAHIVRLYCKSKGEELTAEGIYEKEGEEGFRELERKGLQEILKGNKQIISLDEEVLFIDEEVIDTFNENTVIYLSVEPAVLYQRIVENRIPMFLSSENAEETIRKIYLDRNPFYEQTAHFIFNCSEKSAEKIAEGIDRTFRGQNIIENWYAIRTRSRHEQKVKYQLENKSFKVFLPVMEGWSKRKDRKKKILKPLFPGYLFIDFELIKSRWLEIVKVPGVANILGYSNEPFPIPEEQIASLQAIINSDLTVNYYTYLKKGDRVKVVSGPLEGAVGILLDVQEKKKRLVVSVDMLNRAVAVEVEGDVVEKYI
jgi:transcription termination/antitermination protein NusG